MTTQFRIGFEPLDERRCRITGMDSASVRVGPGDRDGDRAEETVVSRVLDALLQVPGVQGARFEDGGPVFSRDAGVSWASLEAPVRYAVETAIAAPAGASTPSPAGRNGLDDDAMCDAVDQLLEAQINPSVARHGGKVELVDVQDGTVVLRMSGGCHGCGMASVTLKQGIETTLRREIPGLKGIVDITDHASGKNPYFASATP